MQPIQQQAVGGRSDACVSKPDTPNGPKLTLQSVSLATLNTPVRHSETHRRSHAGPTSTKHQLPQLVAPSKAAAHTRKRLQHGVERQHGCGCVVDNKVRCPPPIVLEAIFLPTPDVCRHMCTCVCNIHAPRLMRPACLRFPPIPPLMAHNSL